MAFMAASSARCVPAVWHVRLRDESAAILPAVSKRTRGNQRPVHRRPGTRPSVSRPAQSGRSAQSEDAPVIRQTLITADLPDAAVDATPPVRAQPPGAVGRNAHPRVRAKQGSLLASRAATEYVYVAQDLRKILAVGAILFGILVALWVTLVLLGLSPLY